MVTPITAIGSPRSLWLGCAIAALTVCFLWLERLPLRPGIGVAVLGGIALAGALPLSLATDRDDPWFDYRTFAEGLGTPASVRFNWEPTYGPITWQRDGREMLRIKTTKPQYWKLENLEDFDGQRWVMRGVPDPYGPAPEADLEQSWSASPQWTGTATVTVRGLRGDAYAGAGTTLSVDGGDREAIETFSPGTWQADKELKAGDSYRIRFHAPRPNALELSAASSGSRGQQGDALQITLPLLKPELPDPGDTRSRPVTSVKLELRPFDFVGPPLAENERRGTTESGHRGAAQLALLADLAARPAAQARHAHAVRVPPPRRRLPEQGLPLRRAPGARPSRARCRSSTSCSTPRPATASTSRARWRCCCASAASRRAWPPASRPAASASARASGWCATATRTRGSRRGSTASAGSRSTRRRPPRRRAR